jgi:hypothetical protein
MDCTTVTFKKGRSGRKLKRGKTVTFCKSEISPRKLSAKRTLARQNLKDFACKSSRIGSSKKMNTKQRAALRKACRSSKLPKASR